MHGSNQRRAVHLPGQPGQVLDEIGIDITAQCLVNLADKWDIIITATHKDWSTGSGTDRKFLSSGGTYTTGLNEVHWKSTSYMMGVVYRF